MGFFEELKSAVEDREIADRNAEVAFNDLKWTVYEGYQAGVSKYRLAQEVKVSQPTIREWIDWCSGRRAEGASKHEG